MTDGKGVLLCISVYTLCGGLTCTGKKSKVNTYMRGWFFYLPQMQLYYIQKFISSLSRVFHVATASLPAIRSHVCASVDQNMLQWLVNLHSGDFVAVLRREWLAWGRDAKRRENKHSNTLWCRSGWASNILTTMMKNIGCTSIYGTTEDGWKSHLLFSFVVRIVLYLYIISRINLSNKNIIK